MLTWKLPILIAILLVAGGALYIRLRWCRSPQAYRAMIAVAAGYCAAGALIGVWVMHFALPDNDRPAAPRASVAATPAPAPAAAPSPEFAVANLSSADGSVIAKYLNQTRDVHLFDPCDVLAMYADTAAVFREIGNKPDALRQMIHGILEKKAAERSLAPTDMLPLEVVVDREIDYAYANRNLDATQVRSYWINSCLAQRRD
jgi:hypothetical protein